MIVGIQGTKAFSNYNIFLRGMGRALSAMPSEDREFTVLASGPGNINSMALEFINITERGLKARKIKSKIVKVPPKWLKENIHDLDFFLYFCNPKESYSDVYQLAKRKDVEAEIYRF